MIFVIETIDVVEGPHDTVRPERTMSGPYPDVDEALQLAEKLRETYRNASRGSTLGDGLRPMAPWRGG